MSADARLREEICTVGASLYASGYTDDSLDRWAARIREWDAAGLDVFVYFDNDIKVHAPYDALRLAERLGQ